MGRSAEQHPAHYYIALRLRAIDRFGGLDGTREQIAQYAGRAKLSLAPLENGAAKSELTRLADALTAE